MNNKVTPIVEGGLMAAITAILGLASVYLPFVGLIIEFFCPIPIVILTVRQGLKVGAGAVIASTLLLLMFMGPVLSIRIALTFSLCGLVLGECLRRGLSAVKCLIPTLIMAFAAQIVMLIMLMAILDVDLIGENMQLIRESFDQSFQFYESIGVDSEVIAHAKGMVEPIARTIGLVTPIILFFVALINTVGSYFITKWIFKKLNMKFAAPLPPFAQWKFSIAFLYLAAFAALGIYWSQSWQAGGLYFLSVNALLFAILIGLTQGLSLLSFIADRYKISKFIRRIFFVMIILSPLFCQIIAFAGIFDMIFDYRKHLQKKN